jgi:hypothetical protein
MTAEIAAATRLVVQAPEIDTPALKALAKLAGAERIDAVSRGADQAFALTPAVNAAEVFAYCAQESLDCAFVPPGQRLDRVRLLAMDMDSTLITIECVDEIADMMGIRQEVAAITASAMRGEIDFRQSLTRRVALLLRAGRCRAAARLRRGGSSSRRARSACWPASAASARSRCWSRAGSLFHRASESASRTRPYMREHAGNRRWAG